MWFLYQPSPSQISSHHFNQGVFFTHLKKINNKDLFNQGFPGGFPRVFPTQVVVFCSFLTLGQRGRCHFFDPKSPVGWEEKCGGDLVRGNLGSKKRGRKSFEDLEFVY